MTSADARPARSGARPAGTAAANGGPPVDGWVLDSWAQHLGAAVNVEELLAELTAGSLPEEFHRTAVAAPGRLALRIDDDEATHGGLDDAAGRVGGWLRGQCVGPGARVLLCGRNSVAFVSAYLGVLRAGATVVPASPALTGPELTSLCAQSGAALAFADRALAGRLREAGQRVVWLDGTGPDDARPGGAAPDGTGPEGAGLDRAGLGGATYGAGPAGAGPGGEVTLRSVLAEGRPIPAGPADPDAPAILAYTSGTTGTPKGVPLSHRNLLASIRAVLLAWRWSDGDVVIHALPLTHQHGLGAVHASLLTGSAAVIGSRFDPARLARLAGQVQATVLFAVPAMYERLVELTPAELAPLRRLRLAVSGSAPLSPGLAGRIAAALGQVPLERYGTTETGLDVSNPCDGVRVTGSVGRPLPGAELRIADARGAQRPPGEPGEILLKGPQVFAGYLGPAALTSEAFHPGGWFRTGDIGRIDPATGYVEITGRIKELIISGGLNVTPREVELILEQHPAVKEVAVGGLPSRKWGEEVAAWVVARPGFRADPAEIIGYARARLAAYKCPKRIFVVESLPRNNLGKVVRRSLRPPGPPP
jgi:malonyl-CoA/methylmalonyl-CoA synthetase